MSSPWRDWDSLKEMGSIPKRTLTAWRKYPGPQRSDPRGEVPTPPRDANSADVNSLEGCPQSEGGRVHTPEPLTACRR